MRFDSPTDWSMLHQHVAADVYAGALQSMGAPFEISYPAAREREDPDPPVATLLCAGLVLSTFALGRRIRHEHRPRRRKIRTTLRNAGLNA